MAGDLGQLRFLLRGEIDFHVCQCRDASLCCQRALPRRLARVSGDNSGFSVKRFETLLSGGAALPKNSDDLIPADVAMSTYNYDAVGNLLSITRATVPANNGLVILSLTPQAGFVGRFKSRFSLERTLL